MKPQLDGQRTPSYEFGPFHLDQVKRRLLRDGESLPLTQKAFMTLLMLVQNSERVVDKEELMRAVWPDTIVEENNLTQSISMLRKVLGESRKDHKYIVTVQGRGYCFVAAVREVYEESTNLVMVGRTKASIVIEEEEADSETQSLPTIATPKSRYALRPLNLSKSIFALVLLAVIGSGIYLWLGTRADSPGPNATTIRSVAVVPFRSINRDAGDEYLIAGITDGLTAKLRHINRITVPSSGANPSAQTSDQDALTVGRRLQVDSVLDGTIQKDGDRMRVTVHLIRVQDGKTIWSATFDEQLNEILSVQDSISEQVAKALQINLTGGEQQSLAKHYTDNPEAYQAYIKGRYFWNKRNESGLLKAIAYFRQAIAVDQNYALAYAGLADSYLLMAAYHYGSLPPEEAAQIARSAAMKALELDETLAEGHTSLAAFLESTTRDLPAAEKEFKRALELNPNYATARQWYGEFLRSTERFDEALVELKRAQELEPLSPIMNSSLGVSYYYARQYDLVIEQNLKALEIDPNFAPAHFGLGLAFEQKGMYPDAIAEFQRAKDLSSGGESMIAALAHAYAKSGDRARALRLFRELQDRPHPASAYSLALLYVAFGEKQKALPLLRKARQETADHMMLKLDPRLDGVRSDSTFAEVFKS